MGARRDGGRRSGGGPPRAGGGGRRMSIEYRELLFEIGCEEMPASWIPGIEAQLADRLAARLDEVRIDRRTPVRAFVAPRRLVATVAELADQQADLEETVTGPPVRAAFDAEGEPTPAALGFARKQGVDVAALERVQTPKGEYLACRRTQAGDATASVLGGVLAATLRDLAFPKAMRWDAMIDDGRGEFLFGRPVRWLVFLYASRVVPFEIGRTPGAEAPGVAAVRAGAVTYGHRFFAREGAPGAPIEVASFADYRARLADGCVLIDREERRARVTSGLEAGAAAVGGRVATLDEQSALHAEVPDLVEHPAVVTGTFPREFLALPDEVLATTMVHHQHYFPVVDGEGRLFAHFLAVTNTPGDDAARNRRIARNAKRVLVARLRDARFFWDADRAQRLEDRLERLDTLLFHKALGSYRAKSERVAKLAERIAGNVLGRPDMAGAARRAATLCKADLATDMVGEFPELQGVMGGVYAREQGEPETVWKAVYHHYLPIGTGAGDPPSRDDLGEAAVTWAAVALADKLDTVVGLFGAGEKPTGSRDPLGIRRQAQGMLRILIDLPELTGLDARVSVGEVLKLAREMHTRDDWSRVYWALDQDWEGRDFRTIGGIGKEISLDRKRVEQLIEEHPSEVRKATATKQRLYTLRLKPVSFLRERLRYLLEERGFDRRNVRAVTHLPLDQIRPLDARRKLEVLPEFTDTADFRTLATLFKRVRNIARELERDEAEAESTETIESMLKEPAERALVAELTARRAVIEAAVATGAGFRGAFAEAARIGPAVDRFFTDVFVMADDPTLRRARLRLMYEVEQVILQLADVSEIVQET
ncbi:MAG: glycine--tRNA ligase subunit beta [Acidobacteria bacterium]|nr:glycine--tRNA ligase subunit beta [Acidobacteriota bacterium]